MIKKAEEYAKSITKNETYQKYLINAVLFGVKMLNDTNKELQFKIDSSKNKEINEKRTNN